MPAEKNAVFLPMQYGFKMERQRVKLFIYCIPFIVCHICMCILFDNTYILLLSKFIGSFSV